MVLHINQQQASSWSVHEVIERWHQLFRGSLLSQRYLQGEPLGRAEQESLSDQVEEWRSRLTSVSWFMRCSNEPIAREADSAYPDLCRQRALKAPGGYTSAKEVDGSHKEIHPVRAGRLARSAPR